VVEGAMASDGAVISVVNWAEVLSKSIENGVPPETVREGLERAGVLGAVLRIEPVTEEDAATIARLRPLTRSAGLGRGDRACLALAKRLGAPAVTVDGSGRASPARSAWTCGSCGDPNSFAAPQRQAR
jgi:ribonuclease VapC